MIRRALARVCFLLWSVTETRGVFPGPAPCSALTCENKRTPARTLVCVLNSSSSWSYTSQCARVYIIYALPLQVQPEAACHVTWSSKPRALKGCFLSRARADKWSARKHARSGARRRRLQVSISRALSPRDLLQRPPRADVIEEQQQQQPSVAMSYVTARKTKAEPKSAPWSWKPPQAWICVEGRWSTLGASTSLEAADRRFTEPAGHRSHQPPPPPLLELQSLHWQAFCPPTQQTKSQGTCLRLELSRLLCPACQVRAGEAAAHRASLMRAAPPPVFFLQMLPDCGSGAHLWRPEKHPSCTCERSREDAAHQAEPPQEPERWVLRSSSVPSEPHAGFYQFVVGLQEQVCGRACADRGCQGVLRLNMMPYGVGSVHLTGWSTGGGQCRQRQGGAGLLVWADVMLSCCTVTLVRAPLQTRNSAFF